MAKYIDIELKKQAFEFIQNNPNICGMELKHALSGMNIEITKNTANTWKRQAGCSNRISKDLKKQIVSYIKEHNSEQKELREAIRSRFNIDSSLNTIRTWRRENKCLSGQATYVRMRNKWIQANYLNYTDEEIVEKIKEKYGKDINEHSVLKLRCKLNLPRKRGFKVETKTCPICGKEFTITCREKNKKYCSRACVYESIKSKTRLKYQNITIKDIEQFILNYRNFIFTIINTHVKFLTQEERDEVYTDVIINGKGIIFWINHNNPSQKYINNYIAFVTKKQINSFCKKKLIWENNTCSFNPELAKSF